MAASAVETGLVLRLPPGWKVLEDGGLTLPRLKDAGRGVGRLLRNTVIAREDGDDARWPTILTLGAVPYREQDLDRMAAEFRELLDAPEGSDDASSEVRTGADAAPGELALVSVPLEGGRRFGASVMWVVPRADDPWVLAVTMVRDWERDGRTLTRIVASLR